jgi:ectoine hydroxylase-related dioxygenase (phytanoyl-CoA dioxygenase family)
MRTLTPDEVASHLKTIEAQGYTVVEDAIEADLVDEIAEALDRLEHDLGTTPADNSFEGRDTWRVYNLLVHGDVFARIPTHPNVLPVVEAVLDPGCLLSSLSSIAIGPGEGAQPIHADDQLIPLPKPHPPVVCNTMWALTDFTEPNGATRLVSGTHVQDNPDFGGDYTSVPAEMARGSVLVWHGSLWHGGGANTTGRRRVGIACNYCAGYIRQQENQQLGIPRVDRSRLRRAAGPPVRLRPLPGAHRPHRQARPHRPAPGRGLGRDGLGRDLSAGSAPGRGRDHPLGQLRPAHQQVRQVGVGLVVDEG